MPEKTRTEKMLKLTFPLENIFCRFPQPGNHYYLNQAPVITY